MKELEMIQNRQKARFLSKIIEMESQGWQPVWETFRIVSQPKPTFGKQADKFDYFILLKR